MADDDGWVNEFLHSLIGKRSYDDLQRIIHDFDQRNPGALVQFQDSALSGAFAGLVVSYAWILFSEKGRGGRTRRQLVDTMAGGAIAGAIIVCGLSRLIGSTPQRENEPPPVLASEYLEWPNQRQFEFFRSLLIPFTPALATEEQIQARGVRFSELEECDVCIEDRVHYVLYLTCNHAVICSDCEVQVAFARFTALIDRAHRLGNLPPNLILDQAWFRELVEDNPRRFEFLCVRCQKPCPIEKRVIIEREIEGEPSNETEGGSPSSSPPSSSSLSSSSPPSPPSSPPPPPS